MGLIKSVQKLKDSLVETETIYDNNEIGLFPILDVEKTARRMSLETQGRARGQQELPDSNDQEYDEVEDEVISFIGNEIDKNWRICFNRVDAYKERGELLGSPADYTNIALDIHTKISDTRLLIEEERSELERTEINLKEIASEREFFKKKNHLERTAHYPDTGSIILRLGIILVLWLVESLANMPLLAKGSEFGLTGGILQAITVALLNIGMAAVTGYFGLRELCHRNLFRKLLGIIWLSFWLAVTVGFNLLVAHYRQLSEILITDPGFAQQLFGQFSANPFGLNDFHSWLLFGIGVLFALVALMDMFKLDDAYPFYGRLDRKYQNMCKDYADLRKEIIQQLPTPDSMWVREIQEQIDEIERQTEGRIGLREKCNWTLQEYAGSIDTLNRQCNELLKIYRSANRTARTSEPPEHFRKRVKLPGKTVECPEFRLVAMNTDDLRSAIEKLLKDFEFWQKEIPTLSAVVYRLEENGSTQV